MDAAPKTHRAMIERCLDEIEQLRADYALKDIYEKLSERESWQIALPTFRVHYYNIRKKKKAAESSEKTLKAKSVKPRSALLSPPNEKERALAQARARALFDKHRKD